MLLCNLLGCSSGFYWFGLTLRGFIQTNSKRVVSKITDLCQRRNLVWTSRKSCCHCAFWGGQRISVREPWSPHFSRHWQAGWMENGQEQSWCRKYLEQVVGNTLNKFIWGQSPEGAAALTGFLQALWAMPSQGGSGGHSGHVGSLPHGPRQGQSLHSSSGPSLVPCHAWVSWLGDLAVPPCPVTRARLRDLVSCLSFPGAVGRWRCGNCVHWGLLLEGWMAMGSLLP